MSTPSHKFKNIVTWKEGKQGAINIEGVGDMNFSSPPNFGGPSGMLSPHDFFIASVNACTMTTFLYFVTKLDLNLLSYTCKAEGLLEKSEGPYIFTEITLNPEIVIENEKDRKKASKAIELSEKYCQISKSIDQQVKIKINPNIKIKS
jgi:uncharacterized OsmC-like protein